MKVDVSSEIHLAIREVVGEGKHVLHEPIFLGNEYEYLKNCLDQGHVSATGEYIDKFEKSVANYLGAKHAIAVVNGTAALHLALAVSGVSRDEEVLIPGLTFVATANAVSYCGANPHLIDISPSTLGIDPHKLRLHLQEHSIMQNNLSVNRKTGKVIRAIVPMHTFGHPVEMVELLSVAKDFNLVVIEDAAESLGSTLNGQHSGTFGDFGIISFNGNKIITTGGGGMVITQNDELANKVRHISATARIQHPWKFDHDSIGYNYRMPNLNAALGLAQIEILEDRVHKKRRLYAEYAKSFSRVDGVSLFSEPTNARSNYWLQTLILDEKVMGMRDLIIEKLIRDDIFVRSAWNIISDLVPYKNVYSGELKVAHNLSRRIINIPSSPQIMVD